MCNESPRGNRCMPGMILSWNVCTHASFEVHHSVPGTGGNVRELEPQIRVDVWKPASLHSIPYAVRTATWFAQAPSSNHRHQCRMSNAASPCTPVIGAVHYAARFEMGVTEDGGGMEVSVSEAERQIFELTKLQTLQLSCLVVFAKFLRLIFRVETKFQLLVLFAAFPKLLPVCRPRAQNGKSRVEPLMTCR